MSELVKRDYGADLTICHGYIDSVEIGLRRCKAENIFSPTRVHKY